MTTKQGLEHAKKAETQSTEAHKATTAAPGASGRFPPRVDVRLRERLSALTVASDLLGVKQEGPMTELYVFRGTTGHAEMVTDDKSGKKLPPHSFGEWVFSRTINVAGETHLMGGVNCAQVLANVVKDGFHHWPELESDCPPEPPPVRPPTLPPDFPDIPQNPSSELQPPPDPSATPDKVAGTTPAPAEPEPLWKLRPASEKPGAGALPVSQRDIPL